MKHNIFKHIFLAMTLVLGLSSCEDRDIVTVDAESAPIVMDLSKESLHLDSNYPSNPVLTVTWNKATYSVPVEIKYRVEISSKEAFTDAELLAGTTPPQNFASFTTVEMNEAAKKIGLLPYETQKMYFRVVAYLGNGDVVQTSNVTNLSITPYLASPTYNYTDLYLIGDATAGAWDNAAGNMSLLPLMKTSDKTKYTFTGKFGEGGFKLIKVKGSWDAQYGKGSADGELSTDGGSGNIPVAAAGYYKLTVDTAALTYALEPVSAPTSATYSVVSIIGNGGDWNTDIPLTKVTFDTHVWYASSVTLKAGEIKFRANNAWDVSWGTNAEFFGTAVAGGANIPVTSEWVYDVYFNDATGQYSVIPVK